MPKKALRVVDMLNDFIAQSGAPYCGADARARIAFIPDRLEAFRRAGARVFFRQDAPTPDGRELERFAPRSVTGTRGCEPISKRPRAAGETLIPKRRCRGMGSGDLALGAPEAGVADFAPPVHRMARRRRQSLSGVRLT